MGAGEPKTAILQEKYRLPTLRTAICLSKFYVLSYCTTIPMTVLFEVRLGLRCFCSLEECTCTSPSAKHYPCL